MSVSRVRYIKNFFPIVSYTYTNNLITVVANNHNLFTGVDVTLTSGVSYDAYTAKANVTSANTFTVQCNKHMQNIDSYCINGFLSNQTGEKPAHTLPRATGTDTIVQSYVNGTGGAAYKIDVSLDGVNWIYANTISHGSNSGNTTYITLKPGWAYMRANVTSVGANTNLVIMTGE